MKRVVLSLVCTLYFVVNGLAQTQRTILYEEYSGENCLGCYEIDPSLMNFIHRPNWYPNNIVLVRYETSLPNDPGPGSLFRQDQIDVNQRLSYYNVPFAPYGKFDGVELPAAAHSNSSNGYASILYDSTDYPSIIADSAIVNSPFALTVNHQFNAAGDSVTVTAIVTAAQNYNATSNAALVLQVVMEEAYIHLANPVGGNGEQDFYNVMRLMIPSASGSVLTNSWTPAATQTVTLKAAIPSYIYDKSQLCFVAFVQDNGPKRVHQAAFSSPKPVNVDVAASSINIPAVLCSNTFSVTASIKNNGLDTLTSLYINYQLDAGMVTTYSWSGSLATDTTTNFPINLTPTAGTHTITVYTSLPNGSADENPNNDKQTIPFFVEGAATPAPVLQAFQGGTFPPANWGLHNKNVGVSSFWEHSQSGAGGYGASTLSAKYPFYTNPRMGDVDEMYVQPIDLTTITSPQLRFDYAYNFVYQSPLEYDDTLAVLVSSDCGAIWNRIFYEGGHALTTVALADTGIYGAFAPTSTQWETAYLDLSAYSSDNNVLIKFSAINGYGSYLYLDNINIVTSTTGIKQVTGSNEQVAVYPNPSNGSFVIEPSSNTKQTMQVYDVTGKLVLSQTIIGKTTIDAGTLNEGIYNISLHSNEGIINKRVVIVR